MITSLLVALLLLSCCDAYSMNGTYDVPSKSAYCFYYKSASFAITNTNTFLNATSDNLYGYASVYLNTYLKIDNNANLLGQCEPHKYAHDTCSTYDTSSFYYNSQGTNTYIMLCLQCNYWLGGCNFDYYFAEMTSSFVAGIVSCSICH
jgi:hypothetical protein